MPTSPYRNLGLGGLSPPIRDQAGFTLLEAIVALVLIASTGLALFSWISGGIASLSRVQEANRRSEATVNVVEFMDRVNPMLVPEGSANLGMYSVRWRAELASTVVDGVSPPFGTSLFQLALYRTRVSVDLDGSKDWFELQLQQVGYKRVRSNTTEE